MKRISRRAALGSLLSVPLACSWFREGRAATVGLQRGEQFPNVKYRDPSFDTKSLDQLTGTVSFVYMWASWCPICADDLTNIQWYWDKYQKNPKFSLVVMNFLDPYEKGLAWAKARKFTLPFSNSGIGGRDPVATTVDGTFTFPRFTPQLFILDQNRIVRESTSNKRNAGDNVNQLLQKLIAEV